MPVRHPILVKPACFGLEEAAAKMIDALSNAQEEEQTQELKEQFERQQLEERAKRENMPIVYVLKDQYRQLDAVMIHEQEEKHHCVLIPVEEHEMKRIKDDAVPYSMPSMPSMPDTSAIMNQPDVYDLPHVKGGRYHEPPRDLKKKKKAKRRQQKQARRKNK